MPIYLQKEKNLHAADRLGTADGFIHSQPEPQPSGEGRSYRKKNGFFESTGGRNANAIQMVSDFKISIGIGILKGMFHTLSLLSGTGCRYACQRIFSSSSRKKISPYPTDLAEYLHTAAPSIPDNTQILVSTHGQYTSVIGAPVSFCQIGKASNHNRSLILTP